MKRAYWIGFNLLALVIFGELVWRLVFRPETPEFNDPLFMAAGLWAIRFVLISLAITPLNSLFRLRWAIPYRKAAGLWSYAFGLLHVTIYVMDEGSDFKWAWLIEVPYLGLGVITISILSLLAFTSYRQAMQRLGKWWKRLHRLVYFACMTAVFHALLALQSSKTGFVNPGLIPEVQFYLSIAVLLLLLRVAFIKNAVLQSIQGLHRRLLPLRGSSLPS